MAHEGSIAVPPPKWIDFLELPQETPKTRLWAVVSLEGGVRLGRIRWYGPWRKYSFYPEAATVFEKTCLRDIADFCEAQTKEQKSGKEKVTA